MAISFKTTSKYNEKSSLVQAYFSLVNKKFFAALSFVPLQLRRSALP
jgi:hypothetical protein